MNLTIKMVPPALSAMKARRPDGSWYTPQVATDWENAVRDAVGDKKCPFEFCSVAVVVDQPTRRGRVVNRIKTLLDALTHSGFWKNDAGVARFSARYGKIGEPRTRVEIREAKKKWTP